MNKNELEFAKACEKAQNHYQKLFFLQTPQEKRRCRRCKREIALVKSLNPTQDTEVWVDGNGEWWCGSLDPHDPI